MNSSSFALAPAGQVFPRFAFLALTKDQISVTHHWTEQGVLRKRTDRLSSETAGQFICTLRNLGYKQTANLSHG